MNITASRSYTLDPIFQENGCFEILTACWQCNVLMFAITTMFVCMLIIVTWLINITMAIDMGGFSIGCEVSSRPYICAAKYIIPFLGFDNKSQNTMCF